MTTIVEKTSDGVIYRAAKKYPIPDVDLLTLLFGEQLLHQLSNPVIRVRI
jgi:4-coumarate--CoA ligase